MIFSQPWAFWLLLGIPILVLIYFLQQKSKSLLVSTLFLLDSKMDETRGGRKLRYIRNSLPLILQCLALFFLVWFLAAPSFLAEESTQRVVVVMDDSADMQPFREETVSALNDALRTIAQTAGRTDWLLLFSSQGARSIYSGTDKNELLKQLKSLWAPTATRRDPSDVLRSARAAAGKTGHILFVTCREQPPRSGVTLLSAARPMNNVALIGHSLDVRPERLSLRLLFRSFSNVAESRTINLTVDGSTQEVGSVNIVADGIAEFSFNFPPPSDGKMIIRSAPTDSLAIDDILPLVVPVQKVIFARLNESLSASQTEMFRRMLLALPQIQITDDVQQTDLLISSWDNGESDFFSANSILLVPSQSIPLTQTPPGLVTPTNHILTRHLSFDRLRISQHAPLDVLFQDDVLLWQGSVPIAVLRKSGAQNRLYLTFDPSLSGNQLDTALLLMLHRYAESARNSAPRPWAQNYRTSEPLYLQSELLRRSTIVTQPLLDNIPSESIQGINFAPSYPSFWTLEINDQTLAVASSHFSEPRTSDLRECAPLSEIAELTSRNIENFYSPDPLRMFWVAIALALALATWGLQTKL